MTMHDVSWQLGAAVDAAGQLPKESTVVKILVAFSLL